MTWWIVCTEPHREQRAAAALGEAGFETWLPLTCVEVKVRHMKRPEPRFYASYPKYLFVKADGVTDDAWHVIRSVDGVRGILSSHGWPTVFSDAMMGRLAAQMVSPLHRVEAPWEAGTRVRITSGPMTGFEALVSSVVGGGFNLEMLSVGGIAKMRIGREQLERVA